MLQLTKNSIAKSINISKIISTQQNRTLCTAHLSQSTQGGDHAQTAYENAKPFKSIPGPGILTMLSRFLPGGKYHRIQMLELHNKLHDEYGSIMKLAGMMGNKGVVMIFDPNDFETLFRNEGIWPHRRGIATFNYYRKHVRPDVFKNMGGLLSESGEAWHKMRTVVSPIMLKPTTVNAYVPVVDEIAIEFCDRIGMLRDQNMEMPANFLYELNKWSLESIARIAVDQRLHILDGRRDDQNSRASQLIKAVDDFFTLSFELEMQPSLWRYIATPKYKQLMKVFDTMTNATLHYIDEAIEKFENNPTHSDQTHEPSVVEKLLKIDKHVAVVMALDMLLAGVDTTSSSMSNCLYLLAKNPEKQEKLRDEIRNLSLDANGKLTSSTFLKAPYLRAFLKEVMRVSPIISGSARAAGRDLVLKGYQIPKGTDVVMANMMLHQDEKHFSKPSEFMPERWLKESIPGACPAAKASNPFVYLPFGFGPRSCVGKRFAEMEIYVLLTRILKRYRIEYNYGPLTYRYSFVLSPTSDLKFKIIEI